MNAPSTPRRRPLGLLALASALLLNAAAPARAEEPPADAAPVAPTPTRQADAPLRYVPADTLVYLSVDGQALRAAPIFKALREGVAQVGPAQRALDALRAVFDLDLLSDIDALIIQFREDDSAQPHDRLLIWVAFDRLTEEGLIASLNRSGGPPVVPVDGKPHHYASKGSSSEVFAFDSGWLLIGPQAELDAAFGPPTASAPKLDKLKALRPGAAALLIFDVNMLDPGEVMGLRKVQARLLASDVLTLEVEATFTDGHHAEQARDVVVFGAQSKQSPFSTDALATLSVKRDDATLRASLILGAADIDALAAKIARELGF